MRSSQLDPVFQCGSKRRLVQSKNQHSVQQIRDHNTGAGIQVFARIRHEPFGKVDAHR